MKVLSIAATNHKDSMNKKLITYATKFLKKDINPSAETEIIDLIDYELPLYRQDREEEGGIPDKAKEFYQKIGAADAVIISFAEHNGSYTAVYKNLFDWVSRIDQKVYQDKPVIIMAASPGGRGGAGVLGTVEQVAPFFGMDIKGKISVPTFQDNFDFEQNEITNDDIKKQMQDTLSVLK